MINIFCEGIGDQVFIADFIESHFNVTFQRTLRQDLKGLTIENERIKVIPIDGCKKINKTAIKQLFINNTELGGKNILIFDADYTGINGNNGFANCSKMIESLKSNEKTPLDFVHYLWPNNGEDGFFEDLLEKIIPDDKYAVVSCLESNTSCLKLLKESLSIRIPTIKEKINSYLFLFNQSTKLTERTYKNEFWHLSNADCKELLLFKDFLGIHL